MGKIIFPNLSYKINGILLSVHNQLGKFRSEKEYADAIKNQLIENKIIYQREKILPPSYHLKVKIRKK